MNLNNHSVYENMNRPEIITTFVKLLTNVFCLEEDELLEIWDKYAKTLPQDDVKQDAVQQDVKQDAVQQEVKQYAVQQEVKQYAVKQEVPAHDIQSENADILTESVLKKYKINELKTMCKQKGLATTGSKINLIQRLLTAPSRLFKKSLPRDEVDSQILERHPDGFLIYPPDGFVFNELYEVIGKWIDETVVPLTDDDLQRCKDLHFIHKH